MDKLLLIVFLCLGLEAKAQLNMDAKIAAIQYNQIASSELSQLMNSFELYMGDHREQFHDDCESIKNGLIFEYATTTYYAGMRFPWSFYRHPLEGKICIKCDNFYQRRFLSGMDAQILYRISRRPTWHELPWMAQLKLRYDLYKNSFCHLATFYKNSEIEGVFIEYNLCGQEQMRRGMRFGDAVLMGL